MEQDRIDATFPTKGSARAGKPLKGETFPITFVIPEGLVVSGLAVGGLRVRANLRSIRAFDPTSPFTKASIPSESIEAFAVTNRKKTTSVQIDSHELRAALDDWCSIHDPKLLAAEPPKRPAHPSMSFAARAARAKAHSEYIQSAAKANHHRG